MLPEVAVLMVTICAEPYAPAGGLKVGVAACDWPLEACWPPILKKVPGEL